MGWKGFQGIRPLGDDFEREAFAPWFERIRHRIPNVPECVANHWLHRHWRQSPYHWMPLARLKFDKQRWRNGRILEVTSRLADTTKQGWGEQLGQADNFRRKTWLGKFMLERGTWPAPIIVFENRGGLKRPSGEAWGEFHLLEGHMRSAYHRHLVQSGAALPEHEVWLASCGS